MVVLFETMIAKKLILPMCKMEAVLLMIYGSETSETNSIRRHGVIMKTEEVSSIRSDQDLLFKVRANALSPV